MNDKIRTIVVYEEHWGKLAGTAYRRVAATIRDSIKLYGGEC